MYDTRKWTSPLYFTSLSYLDSFKLNSEHLFDLINMVDRPETVDKMTFNK